MSEKKFDKVFVEEFIEIKVYDQEIKLRPPTWAQMKKMKAQAKGMEDGSEEDLKAMEEMYRDLGMPQEILDRMSIRHVKALMDLVLGDSKKN